jgi:hypothetical protein
MKIKREVITTLNVSQLFQRSIIIFQHNPQAHSRSPTLALTTIHQQPFALLQSVESATGQVLLQRHKQTAVGRGKVRTVGLWDCSTVGLWDCGTVGLEL